MDILYGIPVLGLVLQFVGYFIDALQHTDLAKITLSLATPIALGALCGVMNERSGVVNIGIEGMMLTGAFVGFMTALVVQGLVPADPTPFFGATPALLAGVVAAMLAGVVVSALHAWLSITLRADQIISGTIINIAALGLTSYLNRLLQASTASAGTFQSFRPPRELLELPLVGWIFKMFLSQGPIAMSVIILVVVLQVLLFRSRWGLRTRAVGEHQRRAGLQRPSVLGVEELVPRDGNVGQGGS